VAKQDQHLTTARLSAWLDGQLSSAELAQSETHLQTCEVCQQQLAELRQTVALLRGLPRPKLPRSFVLPTAALSQHETRAEHPRAPIIPLRRHTGWPGRIATAARVISTLAAVLGIVFLLSGLFGTVIDVQRGTSGVSVTSNGNANGTTMTPAGVQKPQVVTPHEGADRPTPAVTPSIGGNKQTAPPMQQSWLQSFTAFFGVDMAGTRALLGLALLVLGIVGFVVVARRV